MIKKFILSSLFIVVAFSFCSPEQPVSLFDEASLLELEFVKEFDLSDSAEIHFGRIQDIHLDVHENIYILDRGNESILIFLNNGEFIEEFDNKGQGPGEYDRIQQIFIKKNALFFVDGGQLKVSEFEIVNDNEKGKLVHVEDVIYSDQSIGGVDYFWVLDDQTYIFVFFKGGFAPHSLWDDKFSGLQLFDKKEQAYHEILEVPGREYFRFQEGRRWGVHSLPFANYPVFVFNGEGFFYGNNREFKIEKVDLDGNITSTVLELDVQPDPVTQDEARSVFEDDYFINLQQEIREQLPEVWRLYDTFVLDDRGRIWFAVNKDGRRGGELWWVFDQEGNGLFKVELEEPVLFKKIRNGQAYGIHISEMDTHSLVKYSFEEPKGTPG